MTTDNWPDLFSLKEEVVVVTGAGLIGNDVIRGLAKAGATVIIGEINKDLGKRLENQLKNEKLNVIYKNLDITKEYSIDNFIEEIVKKYEKIDGWVNIAYPKTEDWGKKEKVLNFLSWKKNVEMHMGGYCLTSLKIAETMKEKQSGSIINFSSIYGIKAPDFSIYEGTGMDMPITYAAIKGGINMLTKYIASKYGKYNIRANIIAPGGLFNDQPMSFVENYEKKVPLGRMANPRDMVGPVIFLISDASSYITGHILMVDGGLIIL